MILIDSNVLIAALFEGHPHHVVSLAYINSIEAHQILIAAHSIAETYSTLTRPSRPYRLTGNEAVVAVDRLASGSHIVALPATQTVDAIRRFSTLGTGPRLYDFLIGATGEAFGADTIVTWNVRDFDGLFPALRIVTPADLLA